MPRVAVGGFQHETNTFAPLPADFAAFEAPDAWPGLARGAAMLDAVAGVHIPVTGALGVLGEAGADIVPLSWCSACPSGPVTEEAFERIAGMLVEDIAAAGALDGVYLDLHGAMVTTHLEDGEGELLRRVRARIGPDVPIAVSLDLHANVTPAMVEHASVIDIYRTYPHVDMGETGARAARHLLALASQGGRFAKAWRQPDFLVPLTAGWTGGGAPADLYGERLPGILAGAPGVRGLALAMGFPLADIAHAGPGLVAYGDDRAAARRAAEALFDAVRAAEPAFAAPVWAAHAAVAEGLRLAGEGAGPVVIADTQDNPGGGGTGDTTGVLRALIDAGARGAVIGVFNDPETAEAAHRAGVGARLAVALGGKLFPGDTPVRADAAVLALGDGRFTGTGPMWGGARFELGPMALLDVDGVRVALASRAMQAGDRSMFRHLGVEPARERLVAVKSSVHFRADFEPVAAHVLVGAAPGPVAADPAKLDFRRLRPGVRRAPGTARG